MSYPFTKCGAIVMKMVHKIILGNTLGIISIAMIAVFSYHEFSLLHAKLRFVEIADTLNASLLKMRLSEKNYFLYRDELALLLIKKELNKNEDTIQTLRANIIQAVGNENFNKLQLRFNRYKEEIEKIRVAGENIKGMEVDVREAGQKLKLFSENIISLERKEVNKIISDSNKLLLYFFSIVILVAISATYLFFSKMFKSLRQIEMAALSISDGNFEKIDVKISKDECGSIIAAMNSMCQELQTRHELLIQSKKLASLGILTAGVAHELGNPLNNISMVAQTYLDRYDYLCKEDRVDYMKTVLEESERIKNIVQNLLDFSRSKETKFKSTDINSVIKNSHKLLKNMLHVSGIETKLYLQKELPPVFIDEGKIQEVLINLVTNAIQAMSLGGELSIKTKCEGNQKDIIIEIEDTGHGIAPEFLSNIFDPFFSTKGTQGTGLGLSISYGIIRKHKGKINVKSEVGVGTNFIIELLSYTPKEDKDERS